MTPNTNNILNMIQKKWKPASNLEEAEQRVANYKAQLQTSNGKSDLNSIKRLFSVCPEYFLSKDRLRALEDKYRTSHVSMHNHAYNQINKMEDTLKELHHVITELYNSHLNQTNNNETKLKNNTSTNSTKNTGEKLCLSPTIKKQFLNDPTPIEQFFNNPNNNKFLAYVKNHNITTLGEYMLFASNKVNTHKIHTATNSYCYNDYHTDFKINLITYIKNHTYLQSPTIDTKSNSTTTSIIDNTNQKTEDNQTKSNIEIFDEFNNMPPENFIKDSKSMEAISKRMNDYLNDETTPFIEADCTEEELTKFIEDKLTTFYSIVDKKREAYATQTRRASVRKNISDLIRKGVKYKTDPNTHLHQDLEIIPKGSHNHFKERGF